MPEDRQVESLLTHIQLRSSVMDLEVNGTQASSASRFIPETEAYSAPYWQVARVSGREQSLVRVARIKCDITRCHITIIQIDTTRYVPGGNSCPFSKRDKSAQPGDHPLKNAG